MKKLWLPLMLLFVGCRLCDNDILSKTRSADGAREAIVFERGCGVGGGPVLHVSMLPSGQLPSNGGNVLVAELTRDTSLYHVDLRGLVRARWSGKDSLVIGYDPRLHVVEAHERIEGVSVGFVALSSK